MATNLALGSKTIGEERQPGHWLLASLGKRVLRPGGRELTQWMLARLAIGACDRVVEFAPGTGATARLALRAGPREYIAVERDAAAAARMRAWLAAHAGRVRAHSVENSAEGTGLAGASYSVVYGEAMLSLQTPEQKRRILAEAARLLQPGGRYGMHELCLTPARISDALRREIQAAMSKEIHVGVQPIPAAEWRVLLQQAGLRVQAETHAPMRLLEPGRLIRDEGLLGAARFACNLARRPAARARVRAMRGLFHRYGAHLEAIALVATAP
ncbi:MAG: methyltransferase domain-containing protein [Terriglobales bacterium]